MSQLHVLVAATVTPTHDNGMINVSVIPYYIDYLISTGVKRVFVNGSAGEWCSYSVEERKVLAEAWLKHGRGKLKQIIIHCGALSITDSKELSKHAKEHGADAIGCISPNFLKPHSEEYLVDYLAEVASVASSVPFLYYHIPCLTNVNIDMGKFLSIASHKIPTFCGLKVTSTDFNDVYPCVSFSEKELSIYYGFDTQLLSALVLGVKGAIGMYYNFLGKEFSEIVEAFENGDMKAARNRQVNIALDFAPLFAKYGNGLSKLLMSLFCGREMGPSRLPLKPTFTDAEINEVKRHLENKGYL